MPVVQTSAVLPAPTEARATDPGRSVTFAVRTDADPGALPRVLELFAKRGLVPVALRSDLLPDAETLDISVEVVGMPRAESDHVANCLRAIPLVSHVLTAERTVTHSAR